MKSSKSQNLANEVGQEKETENNIVAKLQKNTSSYNHICIRVYIHTCVWGGMYMYIIILVFYSFQLKHCMIILSRIFLFSCVFFFPYQ